MLKKLLLGFFLRCPNCGKGRISDGLFSIRKECDVCHVVYERKSGESAGAMAILMMGLPILPLILFFTMVLINDEWGLPILLGVPILITVVTGIFAYRHIRGLWIAIAYLTGSVYADDDASRSKT
jgi:uncharacterized protein (DUF983 family)